MIEEARPMWDRVESNKQKKKNWSSVIKVHIQYASSPPAAHNDEMKMSYYMYDVYKYEISHSACCVPTRDGDSAKFQENWIGGLGDSGVVDDNPANLSWL